VCVIQVQIVRSVHTVCTIWVCTCSLQGSSSTCTVVLTKNNRVLKYTSTQEYRYNCTKYEQVGVNKTGYTRFLIMYFYFTHTLYNSTPLYVETNTIPGYY